MVPEFGKVAGHASLAVPEVAGGAGACGIGISVSIGVDVGVG